jgi:hypothetical protein
MPKPAKMEHHSFLYLNLAVRREKGVVVQRRRRGLSLRSMPFPEDSAIPLPGGIDYQLRLAEFAEQPAQRD